MSKWHMVIDVEKCENCNNCFLAIKDEYVGNDFPGYSASQPEHGHKWLKIVRKERGSSPMVDVAYVPMTCNQCEKPACLTHDGAVYQRSDGIVIIDPRKAKGQRQIVKSCPYGVIWWNDALDLPQKWIFDAHLLDQGWPKPRCETVCPTNAISTLKISDSEMAEIAKRDDLEVLRPEFGLQPRIFYRNLHRFNKAFIGGTLSAKMKDGTTCIEGATVTLLKDKSVIGTQTTDYFGDFKFDRILVGSGAYSIRIAHPNFAPKTLDTNVQNDSKYLGEVELQAK